jgi:hypothetical protein
MRKYYQAGKTRVRTLGAEEEHAGLPFAPRIGLGIAAREAVESIKRQKARERAPRNSFCQSGKSKLEMPGDSQVWCESPDAAVLLLPG